MSDTERIEKALALIGQVKATSWPTASACAAACNLITAMQTAKLIEEERKSRGGRSAGRTPEGWKPD